MLRQEAQQLLVNTGSYIYFETENLDVNYLVRLRFRLFFCLFTSGRVTGLVIVAADEIALVDASGQYSSDLVR